MVEAALLVALATVLSILKIAELPYGGSITLASMFPLLLLSYRHGMRWGLGGGLVYGAWVGGIPGVWWWQKKSTCGGQLVEQNIHLADGLRYLFGEPLSVYATATTGIVKAGVDASPEYDTDDHSTAVYRFENGYTATLVSGCYSKGIRPRCGLYITLSDIVFDYRLRNNLIISTPEGTTDTPRGVDQTYLLDEAFVNAVLTGDTSGIRSDYADALKSHKMVFAANESMESGQVIYFK
jgi:predicted dehydrogenase